MSKWNHVFQNVYKYVLHFGWCVTTNIQVSFLTQLPERKETAQGFHHEANGDFKTVKSLMAVIGENWEWINNIVVTPQYWPNWQSEKKEACTEYKYS